MKATTDFSDVLAEDITIEEIISQEFEFGDFILRREKNHWEIQFEDAEGEQGIIIEREDFVDGEFEFSIDDNKLSLLLIDFDRIEKFMQDNNLLA